MKSFTTALLLSTAAVLSANNDQLNEYPFTRTAKLTGVPGEAAAIRFDRNLYENTNEDYSNIRILDQNGNSVPYTVRLVRPQLEVSDYEIIPGKISNFSLDKKTNTAFAEYTLKNSNQPVAQLEFRTNSEVFNKKVSLQFFDLAGKLIAEEKNLPLYQYKDVYGSSQVKFPAVKASKIKITIHQFSERKESEYRKESSGSSGNHITQHVRNETFDLKGITAYERKTRMEPGTAKVIPVELPELSRTNKGNITEIVVSAHRIPCYSVKISADDKHYNRTAEISLKTGSGEKFLASADITPEIEAEIPLPEQRGDYYIVRIKNANNTPLKNIRLEWDVKERTIIVEPPKGDLSLYYGGKAEKQIYDIEHYADKFGLPPQIYQLGEETDSPEYAPALPSDDLFRYFMWFILALAAAILFVVIVRMLNKTSGTDGENS